MSQATVRKILQQIQKLSKKDRLLLDQSLAEQTESEWKREAEEARRTAKKKGLDQAAIDRTLLKLRYSS